eukprot:scaffold1756_cov115-Skeletonema_dohrnii-CCMP3373.AAC.1
MVKHSLRKNGKWTSVTVHAPVKSADMLYSLYENVDKNPRVKGFKVNAQVVWPYAADSDVHSSVGVSNAHVFKSYPTMDKILHADYETDAFYDLELAP